MAKHDHDHDQGLGHDLQLIQRRQALRTIGGFFGALAAIPLFGCSGSTAGLDDDEESNSSGESGASSSGSSTTGGTTSGTCSKIPEETEGPYPGDGTNGPNALALSGIVRSDITESFAGVSGTAEGVPLTITLTIVDSTNGCQPIQGYAVYLWHCDRDGKYSLYSVADQNYLRGVQETDANGQVTFTSIFPACYDGRWPHIHYEVYPSLATATDGANKVATSQLALPESTCKTVYAEEGYEASVTNLAKVSLTTDNVFSDGATQETPTLTGSVSAGYAATLTVPI